MTVKTIDNAANCDVEEGQEWLTNALSDAFNIPGNREAQVVISYLEEDGQLNIVTGQLDSSDGTWDCRTQSHQYHAGEGDSIYTDFTQEWGLKKFNQLADQVCQAVEDLIPLCDRESEHDDIELMEPEHLPMDDD